MTSNRGKSSHRKSGGRRKSKNENGEASKRKNEKWKYTEGKIRSNKYLVMAELVRRARLKLCSLAVMFYGQYFNLL